MQKGAVEKILELRIREALRRLKERYPEFLYPLSSLKFKSRVEKCSDPTIANCLSTDGLTIFYDEKYMINHVGKMLEYDIMHIVLHGMLGHFSHYKEYENKEYRDVCMDMQVMYLLHQLGMPGNEEEEQIIRKRKASGNVDFSMRQYYRAQQNERFAGALLWYKHRIWHDNHREWDYKERKKEAEEWLDQFIEKHQEELEKFWEAARKYAGVVDGDGQEKSLEELAMRSNLRYLAGKKRGEKKGDREGTFALGMSSGRNYRQLLDEITAMREVCREQPDSIDPMLYRYGFELNETCPLIEPAEYSEQKAMDLIVIAIDVSGSCTDDETMGKFWSETYRCVSQWSRNGCGGKFLILQCDASVQKEEWIQPEDFTEVPEQVSVQGFNGTNFVPVFERIAQLKEEGRKVDALLYLTDGEGRYPKEKTEYPTYLIMPGKNYDRNRERGYVPDWIQTVRLEEEDE